MVSAFVRQLLSHRHAAAFGLGVAVLTLVALPPLSGAGGEGRRVTLGANRAYDEPAASYVLPTNEPTGPDWRSRTRAGAADSPPIRTTPPEDGSQAPTPAFKSQPSSAAEAPRIERVQHEAVRVEAPRRTKVTVKTSEPRRVRVEAPATKVRVGDDNVRVNAPYTRVAVDDGRVRVRAPFVNLDIRW